MCNFWSRLLLALVVLTGVAGAPSSVAQEISSRSETAQVQSYSREVERIKSRALEALAEFEALRTEDQTQQQMTLTQLLAAATPVGALKQFAHRNKTLIKLAQYIDNPGAWYLAANSFEAQGNHLDALAAAWHAYTNSTLVHERVAALEKMADSYISRYEIPSAVATLELALKLDPTKLRKQQVAAVKARFELRVIGVSVDVKALTPTACINFSEQLTSPLPIEGADYLRFNSPLDVAVRVRDRSMCIEGLDYGTSVPVTILAGLPGEKGGRLYKDTKRTIQVPNRAAKINMGNDTYILPRVGNETVPLKTVNLKTVNLKLFNVPDRGLVPFLKSGMNGSHVSNYNERQLGDDIGSLVWKGSIEIDAITNKEVTTLIPIKGMIDRTKPGLYALVARQPEKKGARINRWAPHITQWLLVSDLGLMTLSGSDGLHVYVNSLETAKPVRKVKLKLVAQNNSILATTQTNRNGIGSFASAIINGKGGNRPAAIVAETEKNDYIFLKLTGPALDLSERGASGRASSGPLDAFLFTDRGIYRPGEPVHIGALLRSAKANAVSELPLTFKVTRPDGLEAFKQTLSGDDLGGYQFNYNLSASARTGGWRVSVFADDEKKPIGAAKFQVDDFVPQRLTAKLTVIDDKINDQEPLQATIQADFLYGAPGADLKGNIYVSLEGDPTPFKAYKGYQFGLVNDDFTQRRLAKESFVTDHDGTSRMDIKISAYPDTSKPLRARLTAEVNDIGGRPVGDSLLVPVRSKSVQLGIKSSKTGAFGETEIAKFNAVALNRSGEGIPEHTLTAVWVREHYSYNWYNRRARWQYRVDIHDEVIAEEKIETKSDGNIDLERTLSPGRYRVELYDEDAEAATSLRFNVGWWTRGHSPDVPDALELTLDDTQAVSGGKLKGFVKAPFAGTAMITVVNDQILSHKAVELKENGSNFDIKIGTNWGPGAYILATALRPDAGAVSRLPVRATGLAWFSIDQKKRVYGLAFDVPETALPGQRVEIPVRMEGGPISGKHKMMIAAVDVGILNITRFKSPNPAKHYFGQRNFSIDIHDIYGRLIRSEEGTRGILRTGGDLAFEEMRVSGSRIAGDKDNLASPVTRTTKTVALFEQDIKLNSKGEGTLSLDIPDFSGQLRLMAVAYGARAVGQGQENLTVRTPVVADLVLPRFLAPGDTAHAVLSLQNLSGKDTDVTVEFTKDSEFINLTNNTGVISLADGERRDVPVLLSAIAPGDTGISLSVTGSGTHPIARNWSISVRAAWPYTTKRHVTPLAAGSTSILRSDALTSFLPQTVDQRLSISSRPNLEVSRLMTDLGYYAYWCSEQTVSKAYPSLLYDKLARQYDLSTNHDSAANNVENAILRLVDRQKSNGSFGVWSWSGSANPWLDMYVTDFLLRAKEVGYRVADATIELALSNIKRHAGTRKQETEFYAAYAYYILARLGEVSASEVRYFANNKGAKIGTPLAYAHLGAALHLVGEPGEGERYFNIALRGSRGKAYVRDYGSRLRDSAAIAALIAEVKPDADHLAALAEALERDFSAKKWLNTQEMGAISRAAAAFSTGTGGPMNFLLNNQEILGKNGLWSTALRSHQTGKDITITNTSGVALRAVMSARGITAEAPAPVSDGMGVSRSFYTLGGKSVSPSTLRQNDRLVVILEAQVSADAARNPLIVDLLPAGLEIESTDTSGLGFVGLLTPAEFVDARDDRLVAAYDWSRRSNRNRLIRVAYIVRAITPGNYILPGTFAEDMYLPRYHAQGEAERITVEK